jgi:predicted Zn-ribbon and HTH transcriptional regulator
MILAFNEELKLRVDRCLQCGRFFAVEQFNESSCPYCKSKWVTDMEAENARLKRSNAALRGKRS